MDSGTTKSFVGRLDQKQLRRLDAVQRSTISSSGPLNASVGGKSISWLQKKTTCPCHLVLAGSMELNFPSLTVEGLS